MKTWPRKKDFIDIHSHHPGERENEFRIYNCFFPESTDDIPDSIISCGLHPWHIDPAMDTGKLYDELYSICKKANVVAVGEAGLDKLSSCKLSLQEEIFRIHADVASSLRKPLIVHCVKAADLLLHIRKDFMDSTPWIYHGYNSSPQMAVSLAGHDIYISLGVHLYMNREKLKDVLDILPLSDIFIETDEGSMDVSDIYELVAETLNISITELKEIILGNFRKVFKES